MLLYLYIYLLWSRIEEEESEESEESEEEEQLQEDFQVNQTTTPKEEVAGADISRMKSQARSLAKEATNPHDERKQKTKVTIRKLNERREKKASKTKFISKKKLVPRSPTDAMDTGKSSRLKDTTKKLSSHSKTLKNPSRSSRTQKKDRTKKKRVPRSIDNVKIATSYTSAKNNERKKSLRSFSLPNMLRIQSLRSRSQAKDSTKLISLPSPSKATRVKKQNRSLRQARKKTVAKRSHRTSSLTKKTIKTPGPLSTSRAKATTKKLASSSTRNNTTDNLVPSTQSPRKKRIIQRGTLTLSERLQNSRMRTAVSSKQESKKAVFMMSLGKYTHTRTQSHTYI